MQTLATTQAGPRKRAATAKLRLTQAYKALFAGAGSREDAEIVLSDLAAHTGFYQVTAPTAADSELRFREGQRWAFARILSHLGTSEAEHAAIEAAARLELTTTYE